MHSDFNNILLFKGILSKLNVRLPTPNDLIESSKARTPNLPELSIGQLHATIVLDLIVDALSVRGFRASYSIDANSATLLIENVEITSMDAYIAVISDNALSVWWRSSTDFLSLK
jgi:hypothetical protein